MNKLNYCNGCTTAITPENMTIKIVLKITTPRRYENDYAEMSHTFCQQCATKINTEIFNFTKKMIAAHPTKNNAAIALHKENNPTECV